MCQCNPEIKSPFCGKPGCEWTAHASSSTASTGDMQPISLDRVLNAMREIDLLPKNDQWIVIDPNGRMYRGTVEQVMPVLTKEHPLFKMPLSFGRFDSL